mgnify:CR=1 FL=1
MSLSINPLSFLSGYKTYLVGIAMIILGYYNSDSQMLMEGIAVITLRQGIAKIKP